MNVAELIRILQTHPQDLRVVVDGYEEGYDDIVEPGIVMCPIRLDVGEKRWEGRHGDADDQRREGGDTVDALVLHRASN